MYDLLQSMRVDENKIIFIIMHDKPMSNESNILFQSQI